MPDNAYRNALRKREHLAGEVERLRSELAKLEAWLSMWHELAGELQQPGTEPVNDATLVIADATQEDRPVPKRAPGHRGSARTGPGREELAPVIRDVLLANGRPMMRGELLEALAARGVHVGGTNKVRNLGTMMWRLSDRFENVEGRGYWPKNLPHRHPLARDHAASAGEPEDDPDQQAAPRFNSGAAVEEWGAVRREALTIA